MNAHNENEIIIDTDNVKLPIITNDLIPNRERLAELFDYDKVTIMIIAYNRLDKTKQCIESIFKHTDENSYNLLLIDNASEDETFSYFKSINFDNKKIIKFTKNCRAHFVFRSILNHFNTRYFVCLTNDMIVTKNWLKKLRICIESDDQIGLVAPVISNMSTTFRIDTYSLDEQAVNRLSEEFSDSTPALWEERIRIATSALIMKREVLDITGVFDYGYFHEFAEDDIEMRIRAAGYKIVLAGDTFLHHNHYSQERDLRVNYDATENGILNYQKKYLGIHPWEDVSNFIFPLFQELPPPKCSHPHILGIDTRCGQPLLDIKNYYNEINIDCTSICGFTTKAKYYTSLKYITDQVACGAIDQIYKLYEDNTFDVIVWTESLTDYPNSIDILNKLLKLLKKGGMLLISLDNIYDIRMMMVLFQNMTRPSSCTSFLHYQDVFDCLEKNAISQVNMQYEYHNLEKDLKELIRNICNIHVADNAKADEIYERLQIKKYWFSIQN